MDLWKTLRVSHNPTGTTTNTEKGFKEEGKNDTVHDRSGHNGCCGFNRRSSTLSGLHYWSNRRGPPQGTANIPIRRDWGSTKVSPSRDVQPQSKLESQRDDARTCGLVTLVTLRLHKSSCNYDESVGLGGRSMVLRGAVSSAARRSPRN